MPKKIFKKDKDYYFNVCGYYCSFNCILADCLTLNNTSMWYIISLIYLMMNMYYGHNNYQIEPAEPRYVIDLFGGKRTVSEYK